MTHRELLTALHGIVFGGGLLLLFTGAFAGLSILKPDRLTEKGARACARTTAACAWLMAILAFAAVFAGTYVIYPWYRAVPSAGAPLAQYPKYRLLSDPKTAGWHTFGMEWKEHVAWLAPMLLTAIAYSMTRIGPRLANHAPIRRMLLIFLTISFFCASTAGLLGALLNKMAPTK